MKTIFKIPFLAILTICLASGMAFATPSSLNDILSLGSGAPVYTDTGAEALKFTDTDGTNDDATAFLMLEIAAYAGGNNFGIYGYSYDTNGDITLGSTLQVFSGSQSSISSETIHIDAENGLAALSKDAGGNLVNAIDLGGISFGVYLEVTDTGNTYYSHTGLNGDNFDHTMIFDTSDNSVGSLFGSDVVIAFEDLWGGGDKDFTDMVVGITDVAPVPEPATMLLLGTGLAGMAAARRRKMKKA